MSKPEKLGDILRRFAAGLRTVEPLPNDAACRSCSGLRKDHPAVLLVAAQRHFNMNGTSHSYLFCSCESRTDYRRKLATLPNEHPAATPCTFANFAYRQGAGEAYEAARDFASGVGPPVLVLTGETGNGKSHLLEAIGRELLDQGRRVKYQVTPILLSDFLASFQDGSSETTADVLWRYSAVETLLLDDLGAEKTTERAIEQLFMVIDRRYSSGGALRLAVATNMGDDELRDKLGPRIASRLLDRNTGKVRIVVNTASDYRTAEPVRS